MNWAFFLVRFVVVVGILSLCFMSQRFWHRAIWRSTANFSRQWLRVAVRLLWLTMIFLVICAFIDGVRMDHHHLIPRGTLVSVLVGLWFFSAVFGFVAVKLVRGVDPTLDANAMGALAQWKFQPAEKSGVPIDLEAVVHIPFRSRVPVY